ncbi:hypothetical protein Tco_0950007 [Tanacetum coccineum]
MTFRKKLDKFMMDHARLEEFMMDHAMLMKESMCDPGNYVLPVCVNRTTQMSALADTWEVCFEVGHDEDGNPKYGPVAPSFLDIENEMERALAMEAYFNPFNNIIVFKKLIDFIGSLSVQLKNTDWGNEGYGMYKKIEGDGAWHTKFELITPSGRKFTRGFKTKETKRKLSGKFIAEDILNFDHFLD